MNKKELKAFVEADKEIIDEEIIEKTKKLFFDVLGVEPDEVFPRITHEFNQSYSTFTGYLCTLDGAKFFAGEENWFGSFSSGGFYPAIYQRVDITFYEANWLGRTKAITKPEYFKIKRPADIVV